MSAEKAGSKLWVFLNSNFGLFFFSSIVLSFVTWSYTQWTHSIEQRGINAEHATKLDTEISYRIRLVQNYFKSECAEHVNLSWDTFRDIRNIYGAEPDYQAIFPENREKDLHILIWERRSLVDSSMKQVYFESFVALLDFTSNLNRFLATRENGFGDSGRPAVGGDGDQFAVPDGLALLYGNEVDIRAEVNKLEKDFSAATSAITEHHASPMGINASHSAAVSHSQLNRDASGPTKTAELDANITPAQVEPKDPETEFAGADRKQLETSKRVPRIEDVLNSWEISNPTLTNEEALEEPFLMAFEDVLSLSGRPTAVIGRVERGAIRVGEEIEIVGIKESMRTTCVGLEMLNMLPDQAKAGDHVSVHLLGIKRSELERGQVLAKPGSITPHTTFEAELYLFTKEEGGRNTPIFNGYRPMFYFWTTEVKGAVELPEGVEKVMRGQLMPMVVSLNAPIAMEEGLRFAIREGGRTVGAGMVTDIIE